MNKRIFLDPLFKNNPIPVLALGICSALAVTVKLEPAMVMALSVTLVTGFSSMILSLLRLSLIHISEPTRLLSISYAVFCLKKKKPTATIL